MAVIDRVSLARVQRRSRGRGRTPAFLSNLVVNVTFNEELVRETRDAVREEVWQWWHENRDEVVLTVKVAVVFTYTVRVGKLRSLFEILVGPDPYGNGGLL